MRSGRYGGRIDMMYEHIVARLREVYCDMDASGIDEHVAIQFNIWGEGHGALYMEIDGGKIRIEPYEYYDRDTIISTDAETLLGIASGKIDPTSYGDLYVERDHSRVRILRDLSLKKTDPAPDGEGGPAEEEGHGERKKTEEGGGEKKTKPHTHRKAVKETAQKAVDTVRLKAGSAAETVKGKASEAAETVKGKAGSAAETVKEKASEAAETVKGKAGSAAETVKGKAGEAAETVKGKASEAAETVKGKAGEAAETVKGKANEAKEAVKGRLSKQK